MIDVLIIGSGIAGLEAACNLYESGKEIFLLEKEKNVGGNVQNWDTLFPDGKNARDIISYYMQEIQARQITTYLNTYVTGIHKCVDGTFEVHTSRDIVFKCKTVLIATGYSLFNAERKEEYGYQIYENVVTSADLEKRFAQQSKNQLPNGKPLHRIAFIHCVGSRDEKSGNHYCSKVCCITAVKQAIKMKQLVPDVEVFCFYMDLRMYGPGFEEKYREAQEKWGIQFIRGRVSEVAETLDKRLQVKAEDTLAARPFKLEVDMLVLMIGMESQASTALFQKSCGLKCADSRFIQPYQHHLDSNATNVKGVFTAGACIGPLSVFDTINHARSAAISVSNFLAE
ncbi:MAG: FAD-dependent oxidoreductase [Bacteroidales bacterium]|jgi:heterodisulfide reductase subunit A|nr:FAD-dependent oxidoreductase [Bacteroidales bacterium]